MNTCSEKRSEKCALCLFAVAELVPDPNEPHVAGKSKTRISGFRCHISRPGANGFPIVRGDEFCGMFTDAKTRQRPLLEFIMPPLPTMGGGYFHTRGE
jgi:hypothetical protein